MFDSVQNNTWLFFRFITVWISVLNEPSFQTPTECSAFWSNSLKNFKDLHMFFKELCMLYCLVINVHPLCLLIICISNSFILSCAVNFVNNFFQLFPIRFCSFEEGIENLSFYVVSCCRVQQHWILYTYLSTKVNRIFSKIPKMAF